MRLTRSGNRRVKIIIASLCTAPLLVGAIVTVASGGAGASGQLAADSPVAPSPGAGLNSGEFDELTMIVPQRPGVDGRIGSDKPARADVPVQGATDGRSVVRPGRPGAVNGIPRGVFPAYRRALYRLGIDHARALGWGSLPKRTRNRSRMARLILSQVPSIRHCLK